MSMSLDLLKSTVTDDGFDLDIGDVKLQCNAVLNEFNIISASFESYMDACERFGSLCDLVESNEGMLDPVVRDFVNRNGELSAALGIDLAMEDDSQDAQKENGEKVTEKKQGIFRRIWEAIKSFCKWIFNAIGSFFHWLGNLFSTTSKKLEWIETDGRRIAAKIMNASPEQIKEMTVERSKEHGKPFDIHFVSKEDMDDQYALEYNGSIGAIVGASNSGSYSREGDTRMDLPGLFNSLGNYHRLCENLKEYSKKAVDLSSKFVNPQSEEDVVSYQKQLVSAGHFFKSHITFNPLTPVKDLNCNTDGKISCKADYGAGQAELRYKVDPFEISKNWDKFATEIKKFFKEFDELKALKDECNQITDNLDKFANTLKDTRTDQMSSGTFGGVLKPFNWFTAPVKLTTRSIKIIKGANENIFLGLKLAGKAYGIMDYYMDQTIEVMKRIDHSFKKD